MNKLHVINISHDPKLLEPESVSAARVKRYGEHIASYTVLVRSQEARTVSLAQNVTVVGIAGFTKLGVLLNMGRLIQKRIKARECDVISTDQYYFGALACYFRWRYAVGLEVAALGFEKFTWWRKQLARLVLARADVIRINGNYMARFLKTEFGISDTRVRIVPIYIDVEKIGLGRTLTDSESRLYATLAEEFKAHYGKKCNFVTVSRLVPIKNISLQIEAVAALKATQPQIHLHIVGEGPLRPELEQLIKERQVTDRVTLHGHVTGLRLGMLYRESDCFMLTSDSEGWGMVLVEALAAGLPILMTNVGAAGELVKPDVNGIIIPIGDRAALLDAMRTLVRDNALRSTLASNAASVVAGLPSATELVERYTESWQAAYQHRQTAT